MLQLILGTAGSGKSTALTRAIEADVAAGVRAYLIIPEQQANLSERTMLPVLPARAGRTFTIAGFTRLYEEVAARYGSHRTSVSEGLRSLVMWQNLRELGPLLSEYGSAAPRSDGTLVDLLLATVRTLQAGAVSPTMLETAAARLPADAPLRRKLNDIALLYAAYDNHLDELFDGASGDELAHLADLLARHDYFAGCHIYIDAFTDFTAEEYAVLRHLLRQADRVTVTLPYSENVKDPAFACIQDTHLRLTRLCEQDHIPYQEYILTEQHRTASPELCALARSLWDLSLSADRRPTPAQTGDITLLCSANLYAEAEATALHILDLVHRGVPYGEMAVFVRDTDNYRGVLDAALERYGIPYYFSEKTTLSEKPLSRLLLCALRGVTGHWQAQDIITMLRTGLCPVSARQIDLFEQYVTTWNLSGAAFAAPLWTRSPDGYGQSGEMSPRAAEILQAANEVREIIMTPLLRLYAATAGEQPLPTLCRALYDFMQQLGIAARCADLAERELAAGYVREAGETVRVFDTVCRTLTDISALLPDLTPTVQDFSVLLRMLFDKTEIASVPSLHDSVTIGSAVTLRVENITAAFVLGLCEGEFPGVAKEEGLISAAEQQKLQEVGLVIDSRRDLSQSSELFYLWRAMTKPARYLYASTYLQSTDGKEISPSIAYNRLLFLFPYLEKSVRHFDLSMLHAPLTASVKAEQEATPTETATAAYQPVPPSPHDPSPAVMQRYFGDTLWLSQSKIKTFVQCPYRFYCQHLLELRERSTAAIDPADSGTFLHYVLEHVLRRCLDEAGEFHIPSEESLAPMTDAIVGDYLRSLVSLGGSDLRTLHTFRRLRTLTLVLLRDIMHELSHSAFRPVGFEVKLNDRTPGAAPPYTIELTDGRRIVLGGTVDRVDCYRQDGRVWLRVVDYKSGAHEFSMDNVRSGIDLQLLIYLFSLCRPEGISPAGMMYLSTKADSDHPTPLRTGLLVNDETLLDAMNDEQDPAYLAGITTEDSTRRGKALISADDLTALEAEITDTLRNIGQDMFGGRATRTPSETACRYCPIRSGCPDAHKA